MSGKVLALLQALIGIVVLITFWISIPILIALATFGLAVYVLYYMIQYDPIDKD